MNDTLEGIKANIENIMKDVTSKKSINYINNQLKNVNILISNVITEIKKNKEKVNELKKPEIDNELEKIKKLIPLFTIRSSCDENKCLDTKSLNYGEITQIWRFIPNNKNQIFQLEKSEKEGFYLIKNNASGLYLSFEKWDIGMKRKGENHQNFKFIDCKNGYYIIENEIGFVLDLSNWKTHDGNFVGSCGKNGSSAQQWKFVLL